MDDRQRKFLAETLVPGILELKRAKGEDRVLTEIGDPPLPYEIFEIFLKSFCSDLPKRLSKRFDLDDLKFLDDLEGVIKNWLETKEVPEEKVANLRQIVTTHKAWLKIKEDELKELNPKIAEYKSSAEEHIRRLKKLCSEFKEPLTKEFGITEEIAEILIKDVEPQMTTLIHEETPATPEFLRNRLAKFFFQTAKRHSVPVEEKHARSLQTSVSGSRMGARFLEVKRLATENTARRVGTNELWKGFMDRAMLATRAMLSITLSPSILANPVAMKLINDGIRKQDFSTVINFQEGLEEILKTSLERAGITKIGEKEITSIEIAELAKAAVRRVPAVPPESLTLPEVPPLPTLTPLSPLQSEAEETLKKCLEENLGDLIEELGISEENISHISSGLLKEMAQDEETLNFFLPEKEERVAKEERATKIVEFLTSLFEEEKIALPLKKLKDITKENFVAEEGFKIQPVSDFLSKQKSSINQLKDNLEKMVDAPALFFTSATPWPLKPVGPVLDAVGAVFPKVKDALFVGFFGGDKEKLKEIRKHHAGLLRENKRKQEQKKLLEETSEVEKLEKQASGLKNVHQALSQMERAVKKPPLFSKPFIGVGNFLRKASRFIDKKFPHPLSIFSRIKKIDFSRFLPPFSSSFSTNLRNLAGDFLQRLNPHLFIKNPAGISIFKFSLQGLKMGLGNFFDRIKNFFSNRILGSRLIKRTVQGAKLFGIKLLTKFGLGGLANNLARIGLKGLIKKGFSLGLTALKLGVKGVLGAATMGITLAWEGIKGAWKGLTSLFGSLFGAKGGEKGLGFGMDMSITGPLIIVVAVIVVGLIMPIFSALQSASKVVALPFRILQKVKILGTMEEKTTTPSSTPQPEASTKDQSASD